jgi:hypothetical protein
MPAVPSSQHQIPAALPISHSSVVIARAIVLSTAMVCASVLAIKGISDPAYRDVLALVGAAAGGFITGHLGSKDEEKDSSTKAED